MLSCASMMPEMRQCLVDLIDFDTFITYNLTIRSLGPVAKNNVLKRGVILRDSSSFGSSWILIDFQFNHFCCSGLASVLCDNVDAEILKMHKV